MILPPAFGIFIQRMDHHYRYVLCLLAAAAVDAYLALFLKDRGLGCDAAYVPPLSHKS